MGTISRARVKYGDDVTEEQRAPTTKEVDDALAGLRAMDAQRIHEAFRPQLYNPAEPHQIHDEIRERGPHTSSDIPTSTLYTHTDEEWEAVKQEFHYYYMEQGMTLKDAAKYMADQHGFDATLRQWKRRIEQWKFTKFYRSREESLGPLVRSMKRRARRSELSKESAPKRFKPEAVTRSVDEREPLMAKPSRSGAYGPKIRFDTLSQDRTVGEQSILLYALLNKESNVFGGDLSSNLAKEKTATRNMPFQNSGTKTYDSNKDLNSRTLFTKNDRYPNTTILREVMEKWEERRKNARKVTPTSPRSAMRFVREVTRAGDPNRGSDSDDTQSSISTFDFSAIGGDDDVDIGGEASAESGPKRRGRPEAIEDSRDRPPAKATKRPARVDVSFWD